MKNILAAVYRRVFTAIALLSLFVGASSSVQAVTTYNDVWGYETSEGEAYLVAIGITQTGISENYHTSFVDTTLTSALGRVTFAFGEDQAEQDEFPEAGDGGSPSELQGGETEARAEVILPVDENDIGDYEIATNHAVACPFSPFTPTLAAIFPVGRFRQTYAYRGTVAEGQHWYSIDCIGPCTSHYQANRFFNVHRGPFYVCTGIRFTFFGTSCIGTCRGSSFHEGCF
jgi:hypothetical protein